MRVYHVAPTRLRDAIAKNGIRWGFPERYAEDPNAGREEGMYVWLSEAWAKCYAMTESAGREPYEVWSADTDLAVTPIEQHAGAGRILTETLHGNLLPWSVPNDTHWDREWAQMERQARIEVCALPALFKVGMKCD